MLLKYLPSYKGFLNPTVVAEVAKEPEAGEVQEGIPLPFITKKVTLAELPEGEEDEVEGPSRAINLSDSDSVNSEEMNKEFADLSALLKTKKKGKEQSKPPSKAQTEPKKRGAKDAPAAVPPPKKKSKKGQTQAQSKDDNLPVPVTVIGISPEERDRDDQTLAARREELQKHGQLFPPGGFPRPEPATWKPKLVRGDRLVNVNDHAASPETANALAEGLMLPRDMERNRSKQGEALAKEAVRHMIMVKLLSVHNHPLT